MIISEKQIMQLITLCKDYAVILSLSNQSCAADQYNRIRDLMDNIANQQSKELKDEIKRLKEKLSKKNLKLKELNEKLREAVKARERWYNMYEQSDNLYCAIKNNFPDKFYKVEWSGINERKVRTPPTTELLEGVCARDVIERLLQQYAQVKIHMIEEVAS